MSNTNKGNAAQGKATQTENNKGVIHGKYKIDKMLFDKIAEGDLAALKMFEDRRKTKKP